MFDRRHALVGLLAAVWFSWANAAAAQPTDGLWAQSLFDEGRKLMQVGNYEEACPKLAESQRLDPGGGTVLNLAICYEKLGKTASAWATYKEVIAFARKDGHTNREQYAQERIAALEPVLSYLTLSVPRAAETPNLEVKLDGRVLPRAAWGSSMPIDPGPHWVEASAPGRGPWSRQVEVGPRGDRNAIEITMRVSDSSPASPPPSPTPPATTAPPTDRLAPTTTTADVAPSSSGNATLGYVVGGTGIALVGVGSYFGLKAFSTWAERDRHCFEDRCDARAVELAGDANQQGNIANVTTGLGLIGVGVGVYLVLSAPSSSSQAPSATRVHLAPTLATRAAGMSVGGAW